MTIVKTKINQNKDRNDNNNSVVMVVITRTAKIVFNKTHL